MVRRRWIGCEGAISEAEAAYLDSTNAQTENSTRETARLVEILNGGGGPISMLHFVGVEFDYCLVNLYRDGNDYINFHADNEAKDIIASISLGATRKYGFSCILPFPSVLQFMSLLDFSCDISAVSVKLLHERDRL